MAIRCWLELGIPSPGPGPGPDPGQNCMGRNKMTSGDDEGDGYPYRRDCAL